MTSNDSHSEGRAAKVPSDEPTFPNTATDSPDNSAVSDAQAISETGDETEPQLPPLTADTDDDAKPIAGPASEVTITESETAIGERQDTGVAEVLTHLREGFERLQRSFDQKIRYDAGREAIIDRLHSEIQEYKADLVFKILRPFALDLINLYDDVGKIVAAHRDKVRETDASEKLLSLLAEFQLDIEDTLARNGFSPFDVPGDEFDPKRQRALKKVTTNDPSLDRTVAERIRRGFVFENRVVRPEMVAVYVCESRPTN